MRTMQSAETIRAAARSAKRLAMVSAFTDTRTVFRCETGTTRTAAPQRATGFCAKRATAARLVPISSNG